MNIDGAYGCDLWSARGSPPHWLAGYSVFLGVLG
jgi:hypothetical protein